MARPDDRTVVPSDTLYAIIAAVGSSVDLRRVLDGIVDLLTEATRCHACFVYLRDDERLRLRAASRVYAHLVGRIEMGLDEGLTGWVARHRRPAFIRDNAVADPRMKYFPELEEERFQSMVAVPVPARSGEVLGVVVLHTVAPREFDEDALTFLVHTASLVAGAIENARLYEETRRRVDSLTRLATLSQELVAVSGREELYAAVTGGVRRLLGCEACELHLRDPEGGRLALVAADPGGGALSPPRSELRAALRDGSDELGAVVALRDATARFRAQDDELLGAVANQVALALRKAELIERLRAENVVRDLFEALAAGAADVAAARAGAAGWDLEAPHVVVHAGRAAGDERPWPALAERVELRLRTLAPGALCDAGRQAVRALLPLTTPAGERSSGALAHTLDELGRAERVPLGVSEPRRGAEHGPVALREAADAARIAIALRPAGGAMAYGALGAYRYLVNLPLEDAPQDRHRAAVQRLIDYDARRQTHLAETLERYLGDRRSGATTARALFIHPNTLRQRLDRIEKLSGLELATEDLLALELALKLVRLRLGAAGAEPRATP